MNIHLGRLAQAMRLSATIDDELDVYHRQFIYPCSGRLWNLKSAFMV